MKVFLIDLTGLEWIYRLKSTRPFCVGAFISMATPGWKRARESQRPLIATGRLDTKTKPNKHKAPASPGPGPAPAVPARYPGKPGGARGASPSAERPLSLKTELLKETSRRLRGSGSVGGPSARAMAPPAAQARWARGESRAEQSGRDGPGRSRDWGGGDPGFGAGEIPGLGRGERSLRPGNRLRDAALGVEPARQRVPVLGAASASSQTRHDFA